MAKEADPAEIIATIRASIEVSRRGSRRIRAHRFRELGYGEEQEAAGFGFTMREGVRHHRAEADQPLVLVECKASGMKPGTGTGQARSYAFWVKPAYYVITDGDALAVWNYQGGAVPNPDAAAAVGKGKIDRLTAK